LIIGRRDGHQSDRHPYYLSKENPARMIRKCGHHAESFTELTLQILSTKPASGDAADA
jgi:hypothetical protein